MLANLAKQNDTTREAVAAKGGIGAVISAMDGHASSVGVQQQGCLALSNLARSDKLEVGEGGIEAVVRAVEAHAAIKEVQKEGCRVLWLLTKNAENRVAFVAKGAIEVVMRAMEANKHSLVVQEAGCGALANLAIDDDTRTAVVVRGGIEAVVKAMAANSEERFSRKGAERLALSPARTRGFNCKSRRQAPCLSWRGPCLHIGII